MNVLNFFFKSIMLSIYFIWWVVLVSRDMDSSVMIDSYTYTQMAVGDPDLSDASLLPDSEVAVGEPVFLVILKLVSILSNDYLIEAVMLAIIIILWIRLLMLYWSGKCPMWQVYLVGFTNVSFLTLSANLWRQLLACMFFLFFCKFCSQKKVFKSIIAGFATFGTHYASVALLFVYWCSKLSIKKVFILSILFFLIVNTFSSYIEIFEVMEKYNSYISSSSDLEEEKSIYRQLKLIFDFLCVGYLSGTIKTPLSKMNILLLGGVLALPPNAMSRLSHFCVILFPFIFANTQKKPSCTSNLVLAVYVVSNLITASKSDSILKVINNVFS